MHSTMAVKQLQRHADTLRFLCQCQSKVRKPLLKSLPNDFVTAICECVHNVLRGVPELTEIEKAALSRHKATCRFLNEKSTPITQKRKRLLQVGSGFFTALLKPIIANLPWLLAPAK